MHWKLATVVSLLVLTGCGLGKNLVKAGTEKEQYKSCVPVQLEGLSASDGGRGHNLERATEAVV